MYIEIDLLGAGIDLATNQYHRSN